MAPVRTRAAFSRKIITVNRAQNITKWVVCVCGTPRMSNREAFRPCLDHTSILNSYHVLQIDSPMIGTFLDCKIPRTPPPPTVLIFSPRMESHTHTHNAIPFCHRAKLFDGKKNIKTFFNPPPVPAFRNTHNALSLLLNLFFSFFGKLRRERGGLVNYFCSATQIRKRPQTMHVLLVYA